MGLPLPRRPLARKLLILGLASVFWLCAAELAYRLFQALRGRPYAAEAAEVRLDELIIGLRGLDFLPQAAKADRSLASMMIHPYQGYQIANYTRAGQAQARYFASAEADSIFDIVLIGGSVAAEFGNFTQKSLIPVLQADPRLADRPIRLHNVACQGHKQPQHALTLEWLLSQGWKPDGVLLLDGFNELAVAAENASVGVNPLFPYWIEMQLRLGTAATDPEDLALIGRAVVARDEAEALRARFARWPLTASALAGNWEIHVLEGAVRRAQGRVREIVRHEAGRRRGSKSMTVSGPDFVDEPAAVREQSIEAWREGSRSMQALCRARGIAYLHVLQPAACDEGSKPLTPEETLQAGKPKLWTEAAAAGYPRLREVGAELAAEGVAFLDATGVFAGRTEPIYKDSCHFGAEGCAILGPQVAEAFLRAWKP